MKAALLVSLTVALTACATSGPRPGVSAAGRMASIGTSVSSDPATRMADNAVALLGQPYRWGGAAPGGFDCSGLVAYAADGAGMHLPRTAHEQLGVGARIARRDVRTGDLVFMHLAHKELHVGIALDGGRFVHAPSSGGHVRIDFLAAAPYAQGFLQARRLGTPTRPAGGPAGRIN